MYVGQLQVSCLDVNGKHSPGESQELRVRSCWGRRTGNHHPLHIISVTFVAECLQIGRRSCVNREDPGTSHKNTDRKQGVTLFTRERTPTIITGTREMLDTITLVRAGVEAAGQMRRGSWTTG